jgi:hypothetical protein
MNAKVVSLMLLGLIFFSFFSIVNTVKGAWVADGSYNPTSWTTKTNTGWLSVDNANDTYFIYNQNITRFQNWNFTISLDNYRIGGYWWLSTISQESFIKIAMRDNASEYVEGSLNQKVGLGAFGLLWYQNGWSFPDISWDYRLDGKIREGIRLAPTQFIRRETSPLPMNVIFTKYASNVLLVQVQISGYNYTWWHYKVTEGFFSNVTLSIKIQKTLETGGVGFIQGSKTNEHIESYALPTIPEIPLPTDPHTYPSIISPLPMLIPSAFSLIVPLMIIGALGVTMYKVGDALDDHGRAGFFIGTAFGLVIAGVSGLISYQLVVLIFFIGAIGVYLWLRG